MSKKTLQHKTKSPKAQKQAFQFARFSVYRAQSFFLSITYLNIVLKEGFLRPVSFSFSACYNEAHFSSCFKEVEQNTTLDGLGGLATDEMSCGSHFAEACSNFYLQCNCTLFFNFRKKIDCIYHSLQIKQLSLGTMQSDKITINLTAFQLCIPK